jgi:3-hydroxyisobutyrate dehydrogenase-like beta-hydroxyacid dehydrogenase
MSAKAPSILKRDFSTKFSIKWMHKDVGLALESARALDLPLPLTAITEQMLRATIAKGYGEDAPLMPNDSEANRAQNRRIEFTVLQ